MLRSKSRRDGKTKEKDKKKKIIKFIKTQKKRISSSQIFLYSPQYRSKGGRIFSDKTVKIINKYFDFNCD